MDFSWTNSPSGTACTFDITSRFNGYQFLVHVEAAMTISISHLVRKGVSSFNDTMRICNITAEILDKVCANVTIEPMLTPLSGETFNNWTAITSYDARADVSAKGFWTKGQTAFCDIRVFNPLAKCHLSQSVSAVQKKNENEKKKILQQKDKPSRPWYVHASRFFVFWRYEPRVQPVLLECRWSSSRKEETTKKHHRRMDENKIKLTYATSIQLALCSRYKSWEIWCHADSWDGHRTSRNRESIEQQSKKRKLNQYLGWYV